MDEKKGERGGYVDALRSWLVSCLVRLCLRFSGWRPGPFLTAEPRRHGCVCFNDQLRIQVSGSRRYQDGSPSRFSTWRACQSFFPCNYIHCQVRTRSFLIVVTLSFTDTLTACRFASKPSFSANPELAPGRLPSTHHALVNNCCRCCWRAFCFGLCHSHHLHQGRQVLHE